MKRQKREWNSIDVLMAVATLCAAVIVVGLLVPPLRPVAYLMGYAVCITVLLSGLGALVYVAGRIFLYSIRKPQSYPVSRPAPPK